MMMPSRNVLILVLIQFPTLLILYQTYFLHLSVLRLKYLKVSQHMDCDNDRKSVSKMKSMTPKKGNFVLCDAVCRSLLSRTTGTSCIDYIVVF